MNDRLVLACEWTLATTAALVLTHLAVELIGAAYLGWMLLFILPFVGGILWGLPVATCQWIVLRRRFDDSIRWIPFTLAGFFVAWLVGLVLAALLFVPSLGLTTPRMLVCLAVPSPIIGLAQSVALRRWGAHNRLWVPASAIAWTTFAAIEIFASQALTGVSAVTGKIVSAAAGYLVASTVGTTLAGGAAAGAITGVALATAVPQKSTPSP